jgi:hypothetical protein
MMALSPDTHLQLNSPQSDQQSSGWITFADKPIYSGAERRRLRFWPTAERNHLERWLFARN